jgi:hypothetical protein
VILALWLGLAVCLAGIAFLALVVAGQLRAMDDLRRRVGDGVGRAAIVEAPAVGLPVGAGAPAFEAQRGDGSRFASASIAGRRHLVVFADGECAACRTLVPDLLRAPPLPTVVVVDGGEVPRGWTASASAEVVRADGVAERFGADVRPALFVVDEGGGIVGRGIATTAAEASALVDDAAGMRIVRAARAAAPPPSGRRP